LLLHFVKVLKRLFDGVVLAYRLRGKDRLKDRTRLPKTVGKRKAEHFRNPRILVPVRQIAQILRSAARKELIRLKQQKYIYWHNSQRLVISRNEKSPWFLSLLLHRLCSIQKLFVSVVLFLAHTIRVLKIRTLPYQSAL